MYQVKKDPDEVLPVDKSKGKDDGRTGEIFLVGVLITFHIAPAGECIACS
jgi:hypothetical protein